MFQGHMEQYSLLYGHHMSSSHACLGVQCEIFKGVQNLFVRVPMKAPQAYIHPDLPKTVSFWDVQEMSDSIGRMIICHLGWRRNCNWKRQETGALHTRVPFSKALGGDEPVVQLSRISPALDVETVLDASLNLSPLSLKVVQVLCDNGSLSVWQGIAKGPLD